SGPPAEPGRRWGSFEAELSEVQIRGADGPQHVFSPDGVFRVQARYARYGTVARPRLEVTIRTEGNGALVWTGSEELPGADQSVVRLELPRLGLGDGNYWVDFTLSGEGPEPYDVQRGLHGFAVRSETGGGLLAPVHRWSVEPG